MPFIIQRNDITKLEVDAIVNSTNSEPYYDGGTDETINLAAGDDLLNERRSFGHIELTKAIITKGYNLPAKHVIHVVTPKYIDGSSEEDYLLKQTYINALTLAKDNNLESIAFPLLASGTYRFPKSYALDIAGKAIKEFLEDNDMLIYLVVYDDKSYQLSLDKYGEIKSYIDENYESEHQPLFERVIAPFEDAKPLKKKPKRTLQQAVQDLDDSFSTSLLKIIDYLGLDEVKVYKKANIDKRLFSKIKSNADYHPSKKTALSFCIALELNLDDTEDLLSRAGYALSKASKFDLIISYFIETENYDMFEIDAVLLKLTNETLCNYN